MRVQAGRADGVMATAQRQPQRRTVGAPYCARMSDRTSIISHAGALRCRCCFPPQLPLLPAAAAAASAAAENSGFSARSAAVWPARNSSNASSSERSASL